jgi:hypothetical protein
VVTVHRYSSSLDSSRLGITIRSAVCLFEISIRRNTKISSIDISLFTLSRTESFLDERLVGSEYGLKFFD